MTFKGGIQIIDYHEKPRDYHFDNIKGLLMFFVVLGHLLERYIYSSVAIRTIYIFIYLFHMPIFIFISGYFSKNPSKCRKGVFEGLLLPYILFDLIWYGLIWVATGEMLFSFTHPGWTLWYLISLFFWKMLLKPLLKIPYIIPISFAVGLAAGGTPYINQFFSISRTLVFLPFFLLGVITTEEKIEKIKKIPKALAGVLIVGFSVLVICLSVWKSFPSQFLYQTFPYKTNGFSFQVGLILRIICYISPIILGLAIISLMPSKKTRLSSIGANTMSIYIFHPYLVILFYLVIELSEMLSAYMGISVLSTIGKLLVFLIAPACILYIASRKRAQTIYRIILYPSIYITNHYLVKDFIKFIKCR